MRRHLYAPDMPDPDLLVRTSGEHRISNYLLWEVAYSELSSPTCSGPTSAARRPLRRDRRVPAPRPSFGAIDVRPCRVHRRAALLIVASTGTRGWCSARSSSARPTASSRSSPRATARSARSPRGSARPTSRFGARLEPTSHVAFQCYRGPRARRRHPGRDDRRQPRRCASSYGSLTHAISMLEAVDQVAQEREPNPALYRMLVGALRTLARRRRRSSRRVLLEAPVARGLPPHARLLRRCGDEAEPVLRLRLRRGRRAVRECARFAGPARRARRDRVVRRILGGDLRGALTPRPTGPASRSSGWASAVLEHHLERRLRSAALCDDAGGRAPQEIGGDIVQTIGNILWLIFVGLWL